MVIFTRRVIIGAGLLLALWVVLVTAQASSGYIEDTGEAAAREGGSAEAQLAAREPMEATAVRMLVSARPARAPWEAVSGGLDWQKCLGGSNTDFGQSIQATPDGGYIMAGYTHSIDGNVSGNHGESDAWVVKLDSTGNIQWQKCLGGTSFDYANSIQATPDNGYIIAGETHSIDGDVSDNHGESDAWVVKLDSAGNIQWQKCLGGNWYDRSYSIQTTPDGGYIMAGDTSSIDGDVSGNHGSSDTWVVKLDSTGNIQWQKCLGGSNYDHGNSIQTTPDDGYIMAGYTESIDGDVSDNHGQFDAWVVKLDSAGNIQWQKCLGGTSTDYGHSIQTIPDGGYIMAGTTNSHDGDVSGNHGSYDAWVVKLDSTGNIQWQKCLGGSSDDYVNSIQATPDGGYITAGYTESIDGDVSDNHGGSDAWVVKLDSAGNIQWQKCLGGTSTDYGHSIQATPEGGYIMAGDTFSNDGDASKNHGSYDAWVVKISPIEWQACYGGSGGDYYLWDAAQAGDGGYVLVGETDSQDGDVSGNLGRQDAWVIKIGSGGDLLWQSFIGGRGDDYGRALVPADGGYILAGYTTSTDGDMAGNHGGTDAWVAKVDAIGSPQWVRCYGGSGEDYATALAMTDEGGYIVAGYTNSNDSDVSGNHGGYDVWVLKIDSAGEIVWQRCYGGSNDDFSGGLDQSQSSDILLIGYTRSDDGDLTQNLGGFDSWLLWLNSTGSIRGQACGGGSDDDFGYGANSGVFTGRSESKDGTVSRNHGGYDAWMITKWGINGYDDDTLGISLGNMTCFGGSSWDEGRDIKRSIDENFSMMVGSSQSNDGDAFGNHGGWDMWAVCLSSDHMGGWDYAWSRCFGGSGSDHGSAVVPCSDGGWLLVGYTGSKNGDLSGLARQGDYDAWVVKLRS